MNQSASRESRFPVSMDALSEQIGIPCAIIRGGTSKGVYFKSSDLPAPGAQRDALLRTVMGAEDALQIDGLGGGRLVTAKLAIVGPSTREDADIDYTYGIVPMGQGRVVYTSNCGNISAGVGPFAIDAGLVSVNAAEQAAGVKIVRIHNANTGKLLLAHVPLAGDARASVLGNFKIAGVPGAGAEILLDYRCTIGAKTGRGMPTGRATDTIVLEDGRRFEVTLCDVANPCLFIAAADLGLTGSELPNRIDTNAALLEMLKVLRGHAAVMLGLCTHWTLAETESPSLPLIVLVAPPADYRDTNGDAIARDAMDLQARLIFYNRCHESMAGTGSMCTAAASWVEDSVVHRVTRRREEGILRIGHPLGVMRVIAETPASTPLPADRPLQFARLGFSRTARRLMDGVAHVPNPAFNHYSNSLETAT
jgi:2-methylaconitate cis-trans-isomerase PrpF